MRFVYTALGDSLTTGVGTLFSDGFVNKYARYLEKHFRTDVVTYTHAKPKITSKDLLHLIQLPSVRKDIAASNIITITIGGNDLLQSYKHAKKHKQPKLLANAFYEFNRNLRLILNDIFHLKETNYSPFTIQMVGLYNPYPHVPHSHDWIRLYNQSIRSVTSSMIRYVELQNPFSYYGKKVLSPGIHPNKKGYNLMVNQLISSLH